MCQKTSSGHIFDFTPFPEAAAYIHPDYLLNFSQTGQFDRRSENDLAVLVVPSSLTALQAEVALARTNGLPGVGDDITLAGYGGYDTSTGDYDPEAELCGLPNDGLERFGVTELGAVTLESDTNGYLLLTNNGVVHVCHGDSGGPMFDTQHQVIGVSSQYYAVSLVTPKQYVSVYQSTYGQDYWLNAASHPGSRMRILEVAQPAVVSECPANMCMANGFCPTDPSVLCSDGCPKPQRAGCPPTQSVYTDKSPDGIIDGWLDELDEQVVGDFAHLGYDQMLMINRTEGRGRAFIGNWRDGAGDTESNYYELDTDSGLLNGWIDLNDWLVSGDFVNSGYDQAMFINRTPVNGDGRLLIADFSFGVPAHTRYREVYGVTGLLNGWIDDDDVVVVGDFRHRGYDQGLFVNRTPAAEEANEGRVLIADFSDGVQPAELLFWENYNTSDELEQFTDPGDSVLVGDFMGAGWDQVMFINNPPFPHVGDKHIAIVDFNVTNSSGPGIVKYSENYGDQGTFLGWHDSDDVQLVGDFEGHNISGTTTHPDQVMFINNTSSDGPGYVQVVYFNSGSPRIAFYETRSEGSVDPNLSILNSSVLNDRTKPSVSVIRAGDFRNRGRAQVMLAERENRAPTAVIAPVKFAIAGATVQLDGSRSFDLDDEILTFSWTLLSRPAGSTAQLDSTSSAKPKFVADIVGEYELSLVVYDQHDLASSPTYLTVSARTVPEFSALLLEDAITYVEQQPTGVFTNQGSQHAVIMLLQTSVTLLHHANLPGASALAEQVLLRTDGWTLRGSPDVTGEQRDWITNENVSKQLYATVNSALAVLQQ